MEERADSHQHPAAPDSLKGRRCVPRFEGRWVFALLIMGMLGMVGCGSTKPTIIAHDNTAGTSAITPVIRGADAGLEARIWVVDNQPGILAGMLRDYPKAQASVGQVDLWQRNGIRILEVPLDQVDSLRASLPTVGPIQRNWLGLLPEWVTLVGGMRLNSDQALALDSGVVDLGPGRFALATRCWLEPRIGPAAPVSVADPSDAPSLQNPKQHPEQPDAQLRIELLPELALPKPATRSLLDSINATSNAMTDRRRSETIAFDRLSLSLTADGAHAYLIVAEEPGIDWFAQASPRRESSLDSTSRDALVGPAFPALPTLGDVLLTDRLDPNAPDRARVVLVLIPRVPDHFELMSR